MITLRGAAACAALVLLSGCAGFGEPPKVAPEALRTGLHTGQTGAFALLGRVAVKGPDQGFSAGLDWKHDVDTDELLLIGPLGGTLMRLTRDAEGVRLIDDKRRETRTGSLEALAERVLGVPLPLSRVAGWLVGRPGDARVFERDEQGRLRSLAEAGWRVEYLEYEDDSPHALPRLLQASDDIHQIRLRVDEWLTN